MLRNTAGQKWRVFAFNVTTNQEVTGDAANITAKLSKDYGTAVALTDVNPTETEDGFYLFDMTQTETNAVDLALYPESSTADVQVIGVPGNFVTESGTGSTPAPSTPVSGSVPFGLDGPVVAQWDGVGVQVVDLSGSITATVGSNRQVAITCNQNVEAIALLFVVERMNKTDVASVADASITRAGTTATLALTSAMTSVERTLRWSLVSVTTGEAVNSGLMFVTYDAQGD